MSPAAGLLVELALKSTAILAAAFAGAKLARRLSAAERHVVWGLALASLLALPVLAVSGPGLRVPDADGVVAALRALAPSTRTAEGARPPGAATRSGGGETNAAAAARNAETARHRAARPLAASGRAPAGAGPARSASAARSALASLYRVLVSLYFVVAAGLLLHLAAGIVRVALSLRRLAPAAEPRVLALLDEVRRTQGIRRTVTLKISAADATPWAWGLLRPTVVVPADFAAVPAAAQRDALVHELSHVARFDFATTLLGAAVCALYWLQPLAWWALRRMARESEQACDDRVLLAGAAETRYATQLLETARAIKRVGRPLAATAMARSSAVGLRIASILNPKTRRTTVSKKYAFCVSILAAALVLPVAALKSQEPANAGPANPGDAAFRALLQRGPANDGELERIVETLVPAGEHAEAAQILADYISRDVKAPAGAYGWMATTCRFCWKVLANRGEDANASAAIVDALLAAFDEVEARARQAQDGNLLIRLAATCAMSESPAAIDRGSYYLIEGFRLGHLTGTSDFAAISFLQDKGWDTQARELAQRLYDDASSTLYQSKELKKVIATLDRKITQRDDIVKRVLTPDATVAYKDGDAIPLYRQPPVYPQAAMKQHLGGSVVLEFTITDQGKPANVTVVSATSDAFGKSATESVSHWLYAPKIVAGVPVAMTGVRTKMVFQLGPH